MLERLEAQKYCSFYMNFINMLLPISNPSKVLQPKNIAHQIQAYLILSCMKRIDGERCAALAYSARLLGDLPGAQKYISQGRMLAGSVYDSPDPDSSIPFVDNLSFSLMII